MFSAEKQLAANKQQDGPQTPAANKRSAGVMNNDSDGDHSEDETPAPRSLREAKAKKPGKGAKKSSDASGDKPAKELDHIDKRNLKQSEKYRRNGQSAKPEDRSVPQSKSKKAAMKLFHERNRREEAALAAARSEMLLTQDAGFLEAEGMERTDRISQRQLADDLDINSAAKIFDLKLPEFGPYAIEYSANGRHLLMGGRRGHLATMDWRNGRLNCELHVRETVRDVSWLHNENLFAVAQKNDVYIYDSTGAEVHCMRNNLEPTALGFMPFHFLLASVGLAARLVFQDVTTGHIVGDHRPGYGPMHVLRINPYNAVTHVGHTDGTVTLWAPQQGRPLVKMLCHRGPVQAMAIDRSGTHMATSGLDGRVRIWDIRMFRSLHDYMTRRPAQTLDISQRGLLAAGHGPHVSVWKDALVTQVDRPYMTQLLPGTSSVDRLRFVPYEDVLGCGHAQGISSLVIPGAGEPNFDAYVANPFQTSKQRQEVEVKQLLDKLAPDTVQLDPNFIGQLDPRSRVEIHRENLEKQRQQYLQDKADGKYLDNNVKNKMKGRNSTAKRYARKRENNITDLKKLRELDQMERELRETAARKTKIPEAETGALGKFYTEKRNMR
ncbi:putative U3 small nucleolar RNA-associated protein 7 [Coemansia sp. Benny D115]|nr:putative U3 small nucleolar RNA-associated protein 7 [Coemansia sp. Benny D115]